MAGESATIDLTPDAVPVSTGAFCDIAEAYKEPLKLITCLTRLSYILHL